MTKAPNVLLINVDQQRYDSLGFTGHPMVQTPHIDALAAKGMAFTSAYTPLPLCMPARVSLLSSLTPEVHGVLWNSGTGHRIQEFSPDSDTWVRRLHDVAGYRTGYLGKWHVHPRVDPTGFAFDHYVPDRYVHCRPRNPSWDLSGLRQMVRLADDGDVDTASTHLLANDAISLIQRFADEGKPWHLRLDYSQPHEPCCPAGRFACMYDPDEIPPWGSFAETFENKPYIQRQQLYNWNVEDWSWQDWSQHVARYFGIISQVDDAIGRVVEFLDRQRLVGDTIIIYTTDHGDMAGGHRTMEKVHNLYEDLVHVPLVVRWDDTVRSGRTCHDFVSHYLDLGPTMLEAAGLPVPESYQGISLWPQLREERDRQARQCITASCHGQQFGLYSQRMVRDRRYKLVWNLTDISEFYDLQEDPNELTNLIAEPSEQERIASYQRQLYHELKKLRDPIVETTWMENQLLVAGRKLRR